MIARSQEPGSPRIEQITTAAFLLLGVVFTCMLVRTAWLCDDSYFTLRTVDNFVNGYGLTWNVDERVQAYTHPLWMLALAAVYAVTHEAFFTTLFLSVGISAAAFWIAVKVAPARNLVTAAILGGLLLSRAFLDYSTSGLENPLTHLLLAGFMLVLLSHSGPLSQRRIFALSLLAGLATLNRMDTLLLYLPALLGMWWRSRHWQTLRTILAGFAPFIAWELFATLYYGFPFPNPAYAKLGSGIGERALLAQGVQYHLHSLRVDPLTLTLISAALAFTAWRRRGREVVVALGVVLYLGYVLWIGGDFMSGRFFSATLLAAVLLLIQSAPDTSFSDGILVLALVGTMAFLAPTGPWQVVPAALDLHLESGIEDEHAQYFQASSLVYSTAAGIQPHHAWAEKGLALRFSGTKVSVGATGFLGYFAGPQVHIVDEFALADPFLARLPARPSSNWKIGHFMRRLPAGYVETLETGTNMIHSQSLAQFYDLVRLVTRGPLWSPERLRAIWDLNTGRARWLIQGYQP